MRREYVESGIELQLHLVAYVKICFRECQYSIIPSLLVMQELIENITALNEFIDVPSTSVFH